MKNNFLYLALIALILFAGCNDEIPAKADIPSLDGTAFLLTANMPMDGATTRIALTPDGKSVTLTWEDDDEIQLVFVQGEEAIKQTVPVENISGDGKSATFAIVVPEEITEGTFDLYGIYGGGGLDDADPTLAVLSTNTSDGSLESIQNHEEVMLYFAQKDIEVNAPNATVFFNHLGSLFTITLQNTGSTSLALSEVRLISDATGWAFNYGSGGGGYDLVNEEFTNVAATSGDYLSFSSPAGNVAAGESIAIRGWYPPLADANWPELKLELRNESTSIAVSENSKPARTSPTLAGKNYHFSAQWNGTELMFAPSMTFVTNSAAATMRIRVAAAPEDQDGVWIDLNNNGIMEPDEKVTTFGTATGQRVEYPGYGSIFTIYGKVTNFEINGQSIVAADVSNNNWLNNLNLPFNNLTEIDLSQNTNLDYVQLGSNQLTEIDLSNSPNLRTAQLNRNQLTSVILPTPGETLSNVNISRNNMSSAAITSLLESLNDRNESDVGTFTALDSDHISPKGDGDELNQVIESHKTLAQSKNWTLADLNPPPVILPGPSMTFTASGSLPNLYIQIFADPEDQDDIWIDLNNDGVMDSGEDITTFGAYMTLPASNMFTIYGEVTRLFINRASRTHANRRPITSADVSNNSSLWQLELPFNDLIEIDLTQSPNITNLQLGSNLLTEIDLSGNTGLTRAQLNGNQLTSVVFPDLGTGFSQLNIEKNKLPEAMVSHIIDKIPDRTGLSAGTFYIYYDQPASPDENEITPDHIFDAKAKNWNVQVDRVVQ